METAAPVVADRPFSHGAEKTSKPQPFRERSCEKTCLVRFPAIWGWSEMYPFREREGSGTRKCQISRSELTNWSGIIELRVFVNKNAKVLATRRNV